MAYEFRDIARMTAYYSFPSWFLYFMIPEQIKLQEEQIAEDISKLASAIAFFIKNIGVIFTLQKGFLSSEIVSIQNVNNITCIKFNSYFDNIDILINHEGKVISGTNIIFSENYPILVELNSDFAKLFILQLFKRLEHSPPNGDPGVLIGNIQKNLFSRILEKLIKMG